MPVFGEQLGPAEIWDVVHYVQSLRAAAHERELLAAGLAEAAREPARRRIWTALSPAAARGAIATAVVQTPPAPNAPGRVAHAAADGS
jgi:hypothetical protein